MNLNQQKQDLLQKVVRLAPETGKPSIFNSQCNHLPQHLTPVVLQPSVDKEWKPTEVSIIELPTPEYEIKCVEQGINVVGTMSNMVSKCTV